MLRDINTLWLVRYNIFAAFQAMLRSYDWSVWFFYCISRDFKAMWLVSLNIFTSFHLIKGYVNYEILIVLNFFAAWHVILKPCDWSISIFYCISRDFKAIWLAALNFYSISAMSLVCLNFLLHNLREWNKVIHACKINQHICFCEQLINWYIILHSDYPLVLCVWTVTIILTTFMLALRLSSPPRYVNQHSKLP